MPFTTVCRSQGPGAPWPGKIVKINKGTWGKLLQYFKTYWILIIIAMICAADGTVFTLAGPDKLSEITDTITQGITPNTATLEEIIQQTTINMSSNQREDILIDGVTISFTEQMELMELLSTMDTEGIEDSLSVFEQLPITIYELIQPKMNLDRKSFV